jgi:MFS transporter, FSR family, fosmidomycin resistance protein
VSEQVIMVGEQLVPLGRDARVIAVVGFGHMVSHFFHLIIAPLFPWLIAEYGYSYAELGFVMTVFFVVSGSFQAAAGFVVDRFGAGGTLIAGLLCLSLAALGFSLSDSYYGLLVCAALAGLGNSVFHPVDFSMLNSRVSMPRLGPAYSAHGLTGSLGWAFAPIFLVTIATSYGWRVALMAAAVVPLLVIATLLFNFDLLVEQDNPINPVSDSSSEISTTAFLRRSEIWWCFTFFVFVSGAIGAAQNFAPSIFGALYFLEIKPAAMSLTTMMLGSALGMGIGGWLVVRSQRLERNITVSLVLAGISALLIGTGAVSPTIAVILMAVLGFGLGLSGPSRDMLIRAATPEGATGRVYGVVYSGLDVGIALAPVAFGGMMDRGHFGEVFYGIAGCMALSIYTAWRVTRTAR